MKFEEASKKVCPYLAKECILEKCMFWNTTVNGKKEVDRKTEPYDMTSYEIRTWSDSLQRNGYENIGRQDGFRDVYVKYEESQEGYCTLAKQAKKES